MLATKPVLALDFEKPSSPGAKITGGKIVKIKGKDAPA